MPVLSPYVCAEQHVQLWSELFLYRKSFTMEEITKE